MTHSNHLKVTYRTHTAFAAQHSMLILLVTVIPAIPIRAAEKSTHVAIVITARGGHIGFLDGFWPNTKDEYMARLFTQYFSATLLNSEFASIAESMMY